MKIAIVLNTSWNIYNFRMGLIRSLQARGYEVHAIAPEDNFSQLLVDSGCIYHKVRMDSRGANPLKDLGLIFELRSIYKKIKPDIICHYTIKPNIYGTVAARTLKIPVINNVCGLGTVFLKDNLISRIAIAMYRFAFRTPRKVFFQNQDDYQLFLEKKLVKKRLADVVPGSGIDLNHFKPQPGKKNPTFTFLLISRLITDKGILEYIEAIQKLRQQGVDARFQILGAKDPAHKRGIAVDVIDSWIDNNIIEYLGTTKDVREFINKADCVVLPSYREGTPRTLLEAASSAKPIVATDVPGCRNVVENNYNGLLCKLKDADSLAGKMKEMMDMPQEKRQEMGINSRKKVENEFGENIVISKYLKTIDEISPGIVQ